MMDKTGALYFGASLYNLLIWFFPIFIVYLPSIKLTEIKYEFKNAPFNIFLLSLLNVAGYILQLRAFQIGEVTRIIPIVQLSTILTVLAGVFILKESENLNQKIIASLMAFVGVYFLAAL